MTHRIRVSLLLVNEERLLFVRESAEARTADIDIDPAREGFWQLPGGGLEPGESVYEGAAREAREETGLVVQPERVVYVQEYVNPIEPFYQVEFIVFASVLEGFPQVSGDDAVFALEYLSKHDRDEFNIASWHDRPVIWTDLERRFPMFRHLGVDSVQSKMPRRQHSTPFQTTADSGRGR